LFNREKINVPFDFTGHDRSIRLWNFETKTCIQELTAHQKKDDESIHDVAFHLSKPYMASVGADSIAKIYA
jgi:striatin 1/3/4